MCHSGPMARRMAVLAGAIVICAGLAGCGEIHGSTGVPAPSPPTTSSTVHEATITVPNVVASSMTGASEILNNHDLQQVISEVHSSTVPPGIVLSERPPAGSTVAKGSAITLVVSLGPRVVSPPVT